MSILRFFSGGAKKSVSDTYPLPVSATTTGSIVDDAAFTPGTTEVFPMGALADEISPDSVDEGDVGIPRMTLDRLLKTSTQDHIRSISGAHSQDLTICASWRTPRKPRSSDLGRNWPLVKRSPGVGCPVSKIVPELC